jgi:hypothetical protein
MSYHITTFPNEPIILLSVSEDYDIQRDLTYSNKDVIAHLERAPEPVFYVNDLSKLDLDFESLMYAANYLCLGETSTYNHPKVRQVLFVGGNEMMLMAAEGIQTETFGSVNARVFGTVDEALAYARERI